jgi:hypothetical protein
VLTTSLLLGLAAGVAGCGGSSEPAPEPQVGGGEAREKDYFDIPQEGADAVVVRFKEPVKTFDATKNNAVLRVVLVGFMLCSKVAPPDKYLVVGLHKTPPRAGSPAPTRFFAALPSTFRDFVSERISTEEFFKQVLVSDDVTALGQELRKRRSGE